MKYVSHLTILISICFVLAGTSINAADTSAQTKPDDQPELKVINLTVYPAPIPRPAMKYHLLPRLADQTPGNAALLYHEIFEHFPSWYMRFPMDNNVEINPDLDAQHSNDYVVKFEKLSQWQEMPLNELPKEEIRKVLSRMESWIEYLEIASKRRECDWGWPIHEVENPRDVNIDEAFYTRTLVKLLALRARLSLAEGKPEEAIESLRLGFTLSQQVGKGPFILNYLMGDTIANWMRDQLLDLSQLKDAPNLYWSLSALPRPFLNFNDAVEWEESTIERQLPELQEARKGQHSPEEWQKLWEGVVDRINNFPYFNKIPYFNIEDQPEKCDAKKLLTENYPKARDYLINLDWPEKEIHSMAPAQVLLLYCSEILAEMRDDHTKWLGIKYSQWPNNLRYHYDDLLKIYKQKEILPLSYFLSATGAAARVQARTEREFESLRCIEAIRLYAYSHDGKLPGSLDDIKEVPIPTNSTTGKPFSYRLEGDTGVLLADGDTRIDYEYRIKIAK